MVSVGTDGDGKHRSAVLGTGSSIMLIIPCESLSV